jgi:ceramide glucosyltransferase
MPFDNLGPVATACVVIELFAIVYLVLALWNVARFREQLRGHSSYRPSVTLMVPVCGTPPGLYECLRSHCEQDYPSFQVVFGLHSARDPAKRVIEQLMGEFPQLDATLVIDERHIGTNPKICNLSNMYRAAKHDVIVMLDSDVRVAPGFLEVIVEPLEDPAVGGVTCLYKGLPERGLPSMLGAMHINDWFIPSALVDLSLREMDLTYGAAKAVTRHSLERIGGFAAIAFAVAEDDVFGELLHKAGFKLRLAANVVGTVVAEPDFGSLWRHELRWSRSTRICRPLGHALSVVMHALLPAVVLTALAPSPLTLGLLTAMVGLRIGLHFLVRARVAIPGPAAPLLVPLREALNFCLWVASFVSRSMQWGEHKLLATGGRSMALHKGSEK